MSTRGEHSAAASSVPADDVAAAVAAASTIAGAATTAVEPGPQSRPQSAHEPTNLPADAADDNGNDPECEAIDDADAQPQPPPFEPLFTLLTNSTTGGTVHPRLQYIFSDDDPSILANPPAPTGPDGRPHRTLLIDLAPSADNSRWAVAWASSLSPDFAVTGARLAEHQQAEGGETSSSTTATGSGGGGGGGGSVVLRVEGVEREPVDPRPESPLPASASGSGIVGREDVETLAEDFRRRMGVLRKVVGEAGRRQDAIEHLHDQPGRQQPEAQPADGSSGRTREQDGVSQTAPAGHEAT
ncbi:hypothetical protein HIM_03223 [Hirsutella minnesotensis 3608]|nr:hypothetical protein HIM_03223 [Hirsutella minnesotensis 3608]